MIALMLTLELLTFTPQSQRALGVLNALKVKAAAAGMRVAATTSYQGRSDVLLMWGPGAPDRARPMHAQMERGGHSLVLDLAYWDRFKKVRVSIDAPHPQAWVMRREWPADRLRADGIVARDQWKPDGPVIVAGIGRKARAQYGDAVDTWERQMLAAAAERWPGRRVLYRRKQKDAPIPRGAELAPDHDIEKVLAGASLLITWHSNVAVDAIRQGVPVICQDGAAAAVCPSAFASEDPRPLDPSVRDSFLQNLAWFQWSPTEGAAFWRWATEVLT